QRVRYRERVVAAWPCMVPTDDEHTWTPTISHAEDASFEVLVGMAAAIALGPDPRGSAGNLLPVALML
ncbi:MAG: hypothetical protein AB7P03_21935, partial [Kofleriaceae bacterium]